MLGSLLNKVRGWFSMIFGIFTDSKEIGKILNTQISEEYYRLMEKWKYIYAGYYEKWHRVTYTTINGPKKRIRHSLRMAKVSTSELAKMIFTEQVEINISDETHAENIENLLNKNRFYKVFQGKVEQMLALGGLILKVNPKENPDGTYKLLISYITPDCFIPIAWENEEVIEAAFMTISRRGDKTYCLFEIHKWDTQSRTDDAGNSTIVKTLVITNELYEGDRFGTAGKKVPLAKLYPELQDRVQIDGLTQTLFQYIKPSVANNFDLQSPLGVSIFSNALDTLYALDVAFDSFIREFTLGRRRIIVPAQAIKTIIDPKTGDLHRYFDADDEVYQAMNFADPEKQKIIDNTVPLRVTEHVAAINALLELYCMQTGFSSGTFTFDGIAVKTATEVVSENSKTYQMIKSNENILEEGLEKFIYTLSEVAALYDIFDLPADEYEIEFQWDDSNIGDKYTDADYYTKLEQNSLVSKKYAIMKILRVTEEQALKMLEEIKGEQTTLTPDMNGLLGGNVNPNNTPTDNGTQNGDANGDAGVVE